MTPDPPQHYPPSVKTLNWHTMELCLKEWREECHKTVLKRRACAFCGKVVFGCKHAMHRDTFTAFQLPTPGEVSPAAKENPWLYDSTFTSEDKSFWWRCGPCKNNTNTLALRQDLQVGMDNDYASHLLAMPIPSQALTMSLLETNVQLSHRINGFVHSSPLATTPYLQGPLVQWCHMPKNYTADDVLPAATTQDRSPDALNSLKVLARYNLDHNPLCQRYRMQVS
jgi:hypothetical protein